MEILIRNQYRTRNIKKNNTLASIYNLTLYKIPQTNTFNKCAQKPTRSSSYSYMEQNRIDVQTSKLLLKFYS
jgi:hypothetical protein